MENGSTSIINLVFSNPAALLPYATVPPTLIPIHTTMDVSLHLNGKLLAMESIPTDVPFGGIYAYAHSYMVLYACTADEFT